MAPRMFKLKIVNFASQFSGYYQHDSQVSVIIVFYFYFLLFFFVFWLGYLFSVKEVF